jgi:hypothetical protein
MRIKVLNVFLISFFSTIIIGMIVNRLLPTWEALTGDVGSSGVWLVSLFVNFIYGIAIGLGGVLSQILYKNGADSYYFWVISSGVIAVLLHLYQLLTRHEFRFSVFFLLLVLVSCILFLVSSIVWNRFCRHKSTK